MDMDVIAYKSFNPFLQHRAFSCVEFNPTNFYKFVKKKNARTVRGLNIEAAVLGSESSHPWVKEMLDYYDTLTFSSDYEHMEELIMPLIVSKISLNHGFRYIPIYQVLDDDVHIYPPDTFSSCYDLSITRCPDNQMGRNQVRYARHLCAHSWFDTPDTGLKFKFKRMIISLFGKKAVGKVKRMVKGSNVIFEK